MIEINCDTKNLEKKLNKLSKHLSEKIEEGMKNGLEEVRKIAYDYKKYSKKGILIEVTNQNDELVGRVYTDKTIMPFAMFLEFGTGEFAELPHIGHTKTFFESGFTYWYLPVEKAQRPFSQDRRVIIGNKQYYVMYAQQPKPFMRPAGLEAKDIVEESIVKVLNEFIREVSK